MCYVGAELKSSRLSCDIVLRREGEAAVVAINYYPPILKIQLTP